MSFVTIENLCKEYNGVTALDNVNLEINEGEFFALLGPSGCGKTTTMRCVAGFEEITSGKIMINNQNVSTIPANRRKCGMVFQSYALFPHMTVFENVAYSLQVRRFNEGNLKTKLAVTAHLLNRRLGKVPENIEKKVMDTLNFVELSKFADRLTGQLSGGQQQRVALARALIMEPSVLLMDEPLSNLDKKLRNTMRDTIRDIQQKVGITTIFVTHDQEEAMSMADRVAVMSEGKVEQIDKPTALYTKPNSQMVANFVGSSNILNGTVVEDKQTPLLIKIGESQFLKTSHPSKNKHVQLLIRPESIKLYRIGDQPNTDNILEGEIILSTYLGSIIRYIVRVASVNFEVDTVFEDQTGLLSEGTKVYLEVDPERVIPIE